MKVIRLFVIAFILLGTVRAQRTDPFLKDLLQTHASPQLRTILMHPDSFRYQLIYTQINRDSRNRPHFHSYYLRVDPLEYFNPASTVKMPLSFLALEKMNNLTRPGIDKYSPMLTDSAFSGQHAVYADSSAANGLPSLAQYIKKIFLVSDNDAYNRLYEFLGQQYLNERLWQMGYSHIRITRRFVPMTEEENKHTNPIRFLRKGVTPSPGGQVPDGEVAYTQPAAESKAHFDFSRQVFIGNAHLDRNDSLILTPMDFTRHNNISLEDEQSLLQSVLFPESVVPAKRFHLTADDYSFLYRYMSKYPSEEEHPRYDTAEYFDSYTKFFLFKSGRTPIPPYIRVFNKPGWSYGFLTDVAYIVDFKHKVEFMLSGVIYVNRDGVLNDDKYEYEETGYPFFKEVGNIIYQYELARPRKFFPDLDKFRMSYH
ncbi:MAG: serine hydrolase [Chitinophagaceae bacterium]|nr:serine hydrolase [Chitinophagaceae bacterium]